jgi:uncharacterized membrane protein
MRDRLLWTGCVLYAALFTWLGAIKYAAHRNLVDFGIFTQTVASAFGCFCNPLEGSHWAYHFSPVLYAAAIALWLVHGPLTLVALQAIAGALCAPPVYAMVRERAGESTARLCASIVWLYPPLAGLVFGDFHENGFAPVAVLWMLYAFDANKLWLAGVFALFVLSVKEDQALFLAFAAVVGAIAYRGDRPRRRFAYGTFAAAVLVAAIFFLVIQPHAAANPVWQPTRFYAWTVSDVRALLPDGMLQRIGFLALILVPLGLVPLRSRAMVLAVPPLLEVLASRMSTTFTLGTHYAGAWLGYVLFAFADGMRGLDPMRRMKMACGWALAFCALELLVANPLHPGLNLRPVQPRDTALDAALATLPRGISLATQEEAYTHLALTDPFVRLLPELPSRTTRACFVLTDRAFPDSPRLQEYGGRLAELVADGRYVLAARSENIELFRRIGACR